ncbi:hypothetical protein DFH94DRAFT_846471 [Russula ochroleuca]|uniref:DUF6535 domain-containing protein n=1 Tax=Russula ochroleuca TaxID=152965 RepID=A0A9P5T6D3_9AGAM|nr:hypothetical protein DFH94DRAFT_846471 [Russula ochroleuca]
MATNNPQTPLQGGMSNGDALPAQHSGNELWNMYLDEVKEDDKRIAYAWKDGSNGILVFLSPSSGIQIVIPLADGTYSIIANQPSPPSTSIIWVNAMWLISLVLSLTSALIATLLQQWARRYVETPNPPSDPNHHARVRSFLFVGTEIYQMHRITRIGFSLLHLSVFMFFAGLVIVFHTINKNVAIAVEVAIGLCGLAYIALSILPCLDVRCPYRTPMSYFLWYPTHTILSFLAICLRWLVVQLLEYLAQRRLDDATTFTQRILVGFLEMQENAAKTHRQFITEGLGKGIIDSAINAQGEDCRIVTRLFNLLAPLGDENKLRRFAASIPRDRVLDLIPRVKSGRIVLLNPLTILLRSCAARVAGPDEEVRRRSLLVCLDTINHIAKAPIGPDLNYVLANFANIGIMRPLLDESDTAIRVTSRSICALLAKQVVREEWLEFQQLRWLQEVTGSRDVYGPDANKQTRINLKSFVYGVLSNQEGDLPTEDAASFKETLAILLDVENDANFETNFQTRLSEEVERIHQDDPEDSHDVVHKLRTMFGLQIPFPNP